MGPPGALSIGDLIARTKYMPLLPIFRSITMRTRTCVFSSSQKVASPVGEKSPRDHAVTVVRIGAPLVEDTLMCAQCIGECKVF